MHFCWQLCDICVFTVYACLWWYWRCFFSSIQFWQYFLRRKKNSDQQQRCIFQFPINFFFWITTNLCWNLLFRNGKQFYKVWNYVQPKIIDEIFFEDMKKVIYCRKCPTPKTVKCSFFKALKQVHAWLIFLKKCCSGGRPYLKLFCSDFMRKMF